MMRWLSETRACGFKIVEYMHLTQAGGAAEIRRLTPEGYKVLNYTVTPMYGDDYQNDGYVYTRLEWECETPPTPMPAKTGIQCSNLINFTPLIARAIDKLPHSPLATLVVQEAWGYAPRFPTPNMGTDTLRASLREVLSPLEWAQRDLYVILPKEGAYRENLLREIKALTLGRRFGEAVWEPALDWFKNPDREIALTGKIVFHRLEE